jgi:hypothetical protein
VPSLNAPSLLRLRPASAIGIPTAAVGFAGLTALPSRSSGFAVALAGEDGSVQPATPMAMNNVVMMRPFIGKSSVRVMLWLVSRRVSGGQSEWRLFLYSSRPIPF